MIPINREDTPRTKKKELFMYFREFQPTKKTPPAIMIENISATL